MKKILLSLLALMFVINVKAFDNSVIKQKLFADAEKLKQHTIDLRRDFHQNPELSNREFRTAKVIADYLKKLGYEVKTNVAHTGVVAVLKGTKESPVIGIRADIDALPVMERNDLPFCSKAKGLYYKDSVNVMHACGHDTHIAILMTLAKILMENKNDIAGQVKFIFQPAEEGVQEGEEGGAELMVKEGVLENPKVDVIFGLHISAQLEVNKISYRPGGICAAVTDFKIIINGKQSHGATPWEGVDPILTATQMVSAFQTIVSRNVNITENPAIVTVGAIHGGVRNNIIPEKVEMIGTLRMLSKEDEELIPKRFKEIVNGIANSMNAKVDIFLPYENPYPITYNNPELVNKLLPSLVEVAKQENVILMPPETGAEDFSFFAQKVPGFYFFIGGMPKGMDVKKTASHHTPEFYIDESGLTLGVKTFSAMVLDYFNMNNK